MSLRFPFPWLLIASISVAFLCCSLSPAAAAVVRKSSKDACGGDLANSFYNEKGNLSFSWTLLSDEEVVLQWSLPGEAFIGLGFGIGMAQADMILGWVDDEGNAFINDYWSTQHATPQLDTSLGGTDDITLICGYRFGNRTTLRFQRKLATGDQYDTVLNITDANVIYAWRDGQPGSLGYHGDNHNHVQIDLSASDGIPLNSFGEQESGLSARQMVASCSVGSLISLQTEVNAGAPGMEGFPYGSVADFADEIPSSGSPLLLLSKLERNIVNMESDNRVSLAIFPLPTDPDYDPMVHSCITLMGSLALVPADELDAAKKTYLLKHADASMWIDFPDFGLYRFNVSDVYWVGGFGDSNYIGYIGAQQYYAHKF